VSQLAPIAQRERSKGNDQSPPLRDVHQADQSLALDLTSYLLFMTPDHVQLIGMIYHLVSTCATDADVN
jgi:hypothetical protein